MNAEYNPTNELSAVGSLNSRAELYILNITYRLKGMKDNDRKPCLAYCTMTVSIKIFNFKYLNVI